MFKKTCLTLAVLALGGCRIVSQQELADLVGVSRQTIMQLERNRYNPSMLLAYSIARVFDVTIEELFDFREDE